MKEVSLNDFPREILEEIFSYLPGDSLIQSMQVCKRFNEIIGCCTKLMNKVQICFDGKKNDNTYPHFVMESKRKYSSLCLRNSIRLMEGIEDFVSDRNAFVTCLNFDDCGLTSAEVGLIIKYLENLEEISFTDIIFAKNVTAVPLNFPKLKTITFVGCEACCAITDYFKNAPAVQNFFFEKSEDYPASAEEVQKFAELLISLDGLKNLEFNYDLSQEVFNNGLFANEARFKLDRLALHMGPDFPPEDNDEVFIPDEDNHPLNHPVAVNIHYENFYIFLIKQRCLEELNLTKFTITSEFLELILGIDGLKELSLVGCDYQILRKAYVQSVSIETLYFGLDEYAEEEGIEPDSSMDTGICEIIRGCSAIKTLKFGTSCPTLNICTTILSNLKHLTCMEFYINEMANIQPVTFPTVKTMIINGRQVDDKILGILRMNRQLKHVSISTYAIKDLPKFKELVAELNIEDIKYE